MRLLADQGQMTTLERRWARACVRLFVVCLFVTPLYLMLSDDFEDLERAYWRMDLLSHLLARYVHSMRSLILSLDTILLSHKYKYNSLEPITITKYVESYSLPERLAFGNNKFSLQCAYSPIQRPSLPMYVVFPAKSSRFVFRTTFYIQICPFVALYLFSYTPPRQTVRIFLFLQVSHSFFLLSNTKSIMSDVSISFFPIVMFTYLFVFDTTNE